MFQKFEYFGPALKCHHLEFAVFFKYRYFFRKFGQLITWYYFHASA
ncbi:hypothetical protein LEP1GSC029_4128 [Leptospira interrogans str. 2002000626]|uniref:Uncharacterized protein n=2 Tax=Leptospira interrogans TaxID=173 RepID=A0A829D2C1_LEPIR|nr:hypothetical protein LEP1GSC025_1728 [Leptospira interrogans str. 2002000621]EMN51972.1 hypothetical protein LEP1GSC089_0558 [Leptospira interrogans serovar Autumnalis str. LP101]EMY04447.1 hypothetical protein LEP1GSC029_4128 [Leptospira interrogans str. 2002000626]EMY24597.1 hypothetical protein LEP1GSC115_4140 [Leptospira interrogans serovar Australis str. 200703203]